jgi:tetratricopeptide (TPR) repeat protein
MTKRPGRDSVQQFMSRPVSPIDYARAFSHRGEALLELGLLAEALITFERALGFDPNFLAAHMGRAKTLAAMQQHQAALKIYQDLQKSLASARVDPSVMATIEQAIGDLRAQFPPDRLVTDEALTERVRGLMFKVRLPSLHRLPSLQRGWYKRAVPVLGVAFSAALLSPWVEEEVLRRGWIQSGDEPSLRVQNDANGVSSLARQIDKGEQPSDAGAVIPDGTMPGRERRIQHPASVDAELQLAEAALTGATTLRYRPHEETGGQRQAKTARGQRPLDRQQREHIANYIVEQFGSKPQVARAVVQEAVIVGKQLQLDPLLLLAMIAVESRFDPLAQSAKGAQGLMQVRTAVHSARFDPFGGVAAAFDFAANIRIGAQILQEHLMRHGSVDLALKHYVGAARMAHDQGYAAKVRKEKSKLEQVWAYGSTADGQQLSLR